MRPVGQVWRKMIAAASMRGEVSKVTTEVDSKEQHPTTGIDPNSFNPGYKPFVITWRHIIATIKDAGPLVEYPLVEYPYDFLVPL
jgi:hypothetical protein